MSEEPAATGRAGAAVHHSITTRLIVWIATAGALVIGAVIWKEASDTRSLLTHEAELHSRTAAHTIVANLRATVRGVEAATRALGATARTTALSRSEVHDLVKHLVHANAAIHAAAIAFAPGEFDDRPGGFAPYYHRSGSALAYADLAAPGLEYWNQDWYWEAASSGQPRWSEPHLGTGPSATEVVTFSLPVSRPEGGVFAVIAAQVSLGWLRADIEPRLGHLAETLEDRADGEPLMDVIVLSHAGSFVSRREHQTLLEDRVQDLVQDNPPLHAIVERMMAGEEDFVTFSSLRDGQQRWLYFAPVPRSGWSVGVIFYEAKVLAPAAALLWRAAALAALGIVMLVAIIAYLASRITRPLRGLAASAGAIGSGELETVVTGSGTGDEVDVLATALQRMQSDLKTYIARLSEETAARTRMETELRAARSIQLAMLPAVPDPATACTPYDLAATLVSAREVGGDLYDFFTLPGGQIAFAVGDVSGKGVPAALFMARTLTLFKLACRDDPSPGSVLARLNAELERDNDACMFVTMFCGVLDPSTGQLRCANAGHNPPVIADADGARLLELPGGTVLGVVEDVEYPESEIELAGEQTLLVYTDGITEATDADRTLYGEERLLEAVALAPRDARGLLDTTLRSVDAFVAGAPQADDITVLALRAARPSGVWTTLPGQVLALPSELTALEHARAWLAARCDDAGLPRALADDVQLICEEVLANIVQHAHAGDTARTMELRAQVGAAGVCLAFRDSGPAYNPLDTTGPDLDAALEDRPIGGLGIHLVRHLAARVDHSREDGRNVLVVLLAGVR